MMTEQEVRKLEIASERFEESVNKLIRLEAMRTANKEAELKEEPPVYSSADILTLLD